jgi:hypothetical protein
MVMVVVVSSIRHKKIKMAKLQVAATNFKRDHLVLPSIVVEIRAAE